MLFASDLDRTLIYSGKFLELLPVKKNKKIRLIEKKEEKEISYMSENAIDKLKKLTQKAFFVPVTTRTIEQYKRISIFKEEIIPKYVVVSNGGNILIDGKVDEKWNTFIKDTIKKECVPLCKVIEKFKTIQNEEWVTSVKIADDLFVYAIVIAENIPNKELDEFFAFLKIHNWKGIRHGRKLYFIPNCVNKGRAMMYVAKKLGVNHIAAAGDSFLDLPMLENADYSISPAHGEVNVLYKKKGEEKDIQFTLNSGFLACEEMLDQIDVFFENKGTCSSF